MPGNVEMEPNPAQEHWEKCLVMNQDVDLDINFRDKSISGFTKMTIFPLSDELETVRIDARQMEIDTDNILVNDRPARAEYHDPYEHLDVPSGLDWDASQFPYQQSRISPLLRRHAVELPAEDREHSNGCSPAIGSLKIWLREEEPKPTGKVKVRLVNRESAAEEHRSHFEIVIPFRSTRIRDGLHFVGIEDSDTRYPHVYTTHSGEPGLASCIFPCIDDPGSRSFWTIRIKFPRTLGDALKQPLLTQRPATANAADSHRQVLPMTEEDKLLDMTVVCAGMLMGEVIDKADESKKVMTFEVRNKSMSPLHLGFAVGPFVHVDLWSGFRAEADDDKLGKDAIKIHGYCLPGREEEVRYTCEPTAQAADFFHTKFDKFPFGGSFKMCFVDDMVGETMPLCGLALCSSRLLYPPDLIDLEEEVTGTLVHALACQYFGVNIIPNTRLDAWITVGVAHFMAEQFMQHLCGNNHYRFHMKTRADQLVEEDIDRLPLDELGNYTHLGDYQAQFMAIKASLVLFILDKRLTKRATRNGLRRVINKIASQAEYTARDSARVVSWQSFRKICERISHNTASLELFWQQWIHSSGCARFEMSHRYNKKHSRIDVAIRQPEDRKDLPPPALNRDNFWGMLLDRRYVPRDRKENVSVWFTGPITIGIHEANGTPYEHVAEIRRMGPRAFKTLEMPYNTKYKRLKRTRRQRERAMASALHAAEGEHAEDVVLYSLGDVLQTPEEAKAWQLAEWTAEQEKSMEQDSFEWLRLDADFEWLCSMKSNMQPWMYVSQLQQDRDVVAQQESVLYMSLKSGGDIAASFLAKTLMDVRYFHGIRTQAVRALQKQVWTRDEEATDPETGQTVRTKVTVLGGLAHLLRAFRRFFCFPNSQTPQPNDFSNKMQYFVQRAIPGAVARVRDKSGRCPPEAQRFILEQLRFNNNSSNEYSDHFYIASLLDALATSLVPEPTDASQIQLQAPPADDDVAAREEEQEFLASALQEIERYIRMDEWANSYQNVWTTTALGCKQKLMKAGVIPVQPLEFVRYLQDGTLDLVQIKAFEALVDLGFLLHMGVLRLLLSFMATHHSPFVRDRLFKVFSSGIAGLAFGELTTEQHAPQQGEQRGEQPRRSGQDDEEEDGDVLTIVKTDAIIEKKKAEEARRSTIEGAMSALRQEVAKVETQDLLLEIWKAVTSPIISLVEQRNLLDLCQTLFEPDYSCRIIVRQPVHWVVKRMPAPPATTPASTKPAQNHHRSVWLNFKLMPRVLGPRPKVEEAVAAAAEPKRAEHGAATGQGANGTGPADATAAAAVAGAAAGSQQPRQQAPLPPMPTMPSTPIVAQRQPSFGRIKLNVHHKTAQQQPQQHVAGAQPAAKAARPSIAVAPPATADASSISVSSSVPVASPRPTPLAPAGLTGQRGSSITAKRPKPTKRKHDDTDDVGSPRPSKMVRLKCPNYFEKLKPETQKRIRAEHSLAAETLPTASTIRATPAAARKPLPSGSAASASAGPSTQSPHQASATQKVRKPLPSAPSATTVLPSLVPEPSPAPAPSKIIKLKITSKPKSPAPP